MRKHPTLRAALLAVAILIFVGSTVTAATYTAAVKYFGTVSAKKVGTKVLNVKEKIHNKKGTVQIKDKTKITGALTVTGPTTVEGYDVADHLSSRYDNIAKMMDYLECMADAAQFTTYVESSDMIACWNAHISGEFFPAGGFSPAALQSAERPPFTPNQ